MFAPDGISSATMITSIMVRPGYNLEAEHRNKVADLPEVSLGLRLTLSKDQIRYKYARSIINLP